MSPKQPFYLIVDKWGNIIDYRGPEWKPSDVSPYKVFKWTGYTFIEWGANDADY